MAQPTSPACNGIPAHVRILNPRTGELSTRAYAAEDGDRTGSTTRTGASELHRPSNTSSARQTCCRTRHVETVCRHQTRPQSGPYSIRRVLAILSLVKKHGPGSASISACRAALEIGVADVSRREALPRRASTTAAPKLQQVDALIRDLEPLPRCHQPEEQRPRP